jgi:hypothetical protein
LKAVKKISFISTNKNAFFVLFGFITFLLSQNNGMFWDPVLFASKIGNQIYYNSIFNWTVSVGFDSGHLPFLVFILAIFWKTIVHKLWINRLLIPSFIISLFYQLYHFINHYIQRGSFIFLGFLMIIADPNLAKLPYHSFRLKAIDYLNKNTIEMDSILSFLPNKTTLNYIDFRENKPFYQQFNKKINIFYSNI